MTEALILSGRGRYEDPWHEFAGTTHLLALELSRLGINPQVRSTFPSSAADLASFDLLVVNAGSGRVDAQYDGADEDWKDFHSAINQHTAAGKPVLAVHQSANTFEDNPQWFAALGGRWEPEVSMHPEQGEAVFHTVSGHPITAGLPPQLRTVDERYSYLVQYGPVTPLIQHEHDGVLHVAAWVHQEAPYRVVYDAMGHDLPAFANPDRLALLHAEVKWLLSGD